MYYAVAYPPRDGELAMRQTELHLTDEDRELIQSYRAKGLRHAREVNRAHVLSALDHGVAESQIMAVLGVGRTVIWRTRAAYLEGGAAYATCSWQSNPKADDRPYRLPIIAPRRISWPSSNTCSNRSMRWRIEFIRSWTSSTCISASVSRKCSAPVLPAKVV